MGLLSKLGDIGDKIGEKVSEFSDAMGDKSEAPEPAGTDRSGSEDTGRADPVEDADTGDPEEDAAPEPDVEESESEAPQPQRGETAASYAQDVAMMRAEINHIDSTVLPHYELLISQATKAGNGAKTLQALQAGLDSARSARGASQEALSAVEKAGAAVQQAYDNAGGEAATEKSYFHGD